MELKRPSLLWMRPSDIRLVNASLLHLCLKPEQFLVVKGTSEWIPRIEIYASGIVRFQWDRFPDKKQSAVWLKVSGDQKMDPKWDIEWKTRQGSGGIEQNVRFLDVRCRPAALLVKAYSKHFPFVPSDNYFLKEGAMIA